MQLLLDQMIDSKINYKRYYALFEVHVVVNQLHISSILEKAYYLYNMDDLHNFPLEKITMGEIFKIRSRINYEVRV